VSEPPYEPSWQSQALHGLAAAEAEEYACLLADPPWNESGGGRVKRGADRHYPLLKTPDIIRVMVQSPKFRPAANAHLWLWVTNNFLKDGLHVMEALGFRYVTNAVWVKNRIGLGQYLRGRHELLLFGVRGRQPAQCRTESTWIGNREVARRLHSQKPEESYKLIERVSPGPRVEFFARARREGWDAHGNEIAA